MNLKANLINVLNAAHRWTFLGTILIAPWLWGAAGPRYAEIVNLGIALSFILYLFRRATIRRWPTGPLVPLICLVPVCLQAIGMWYNAHFYHDPDFWQFVPLQFPFPSLPGSIDKAASFYLLHCVLAIGAAFWLGTDLARSLLWQRRLLSTIALSGFLISVFGILEKSLGEGSFFWPVNEGSFFGPFRYHGNTGAFLNLTWPIQACLLFQAFRENRASGQVGFWCGALICTFVSCFVNVSRAGAFLALVILVPTLYYLLPPLLRHASVALKPAARTWTILVLGLLFFLVLGGGLEVAAHKHWTQLPAQLSAENTRLLVAQECLRTIPDAGWLGFGPGTFATIFSYRTHDSDIHIMGYWLYAHNDYLQTVIEWGYVGTFFWALFFLGGLGMGLRHSLFPPPGWRTRQVYIVRLCSIALISVALHACVDFPLQTGSIRLYALVLLSVLWTKPPTS